MFGIPKVNIIESDEGFSVEVLGRTGLKYKEGDKSIIIDSEMLAGPSGLVLYEDSIKFWDLANKCPIDNKEKDIIIDNIIRAFKFRNIEIEIS